MYYGLDIGGTKIEIAAFDKNFKLMKHHRVATPQDNYQTFLDTITELVLNFDKEFSINGSVGIGLPGIRDYHDGSFIAVNIPCVTGKQLALNLSAILQRDVKIENDCKCFALSEAVLGSAKDYKNVFGAIIGTGAGGGQVTDGKLCAGIQGFAGEWGHLAASAYLIDKHQLPLLGCACGLTGCAEQYVSGSGFQNIYQFKYQQVNGKKVTQLNGQEIMKLVEDGDSIACQAFEIYLDMLSCSLAQMQLSYDVDAIVLGGGMSNVESLYERLPAFIEQNLFGRVPVPVILPPKFGDASGVRGAALLHQ